MWCVYFLKGKNKNWYYVGSTNDVERRLKEHNSEKVKSTKAYVPLSLVYKVNFETEAGARKYERFVKRSRKEKERVIREHCRIV